MHHPRRPSVDGCSTRIHPGFPRVVRSTSRWRRFGSGLARTAGRSRPAFGRDVAPSRHRRHAYAVLLAPVPGSRARGPALRLDHWRTPQCGRCASLRAEAGLLEHAGGDGGLWNILHVARGPQRRWTVDQRATVHQHGRLSTRHRRSRGPAGRGWGNPCGGRGRGSRLSQSAGPDRGALRRHALRARLSVQ